MIQFIVLFIVGVAVVTFLGLMWENVKKKSIEARVIRVIPYLDGIKVNNRLRTRHLSKQELVAEMLSGSSILNEVEAVVMAKELIDRYDPVEQDRKIRELEKKLGIE